MQKQNVKVNKQIIEYKKFVKSYGNDIKKFTKAAIVLQRFEKRQYIKKFPKHDENEARRRIIKKFILNYEKQNNEPIINISQEKRNEQFKKYCGDIILRNLRAYKRRIMIRLRIYPIYKLAARMIFFSYKCSSLSKSQNLQLVKTIKIQRKFKAVFFRRKYKKLRDEINTLADPKKSNTVQLLKMLEPNNVALIQSISQHFVIRFRLCDEDQLNQKLKPITKIKSGKQKANTNNSPREEPLIKIQSILPQLSMYNPKIYYKVFLKDKVVDVSETAPRNYAVEDLTGVIDRRLWYVRFTNQPWKRLTGIPLAQDKFTAKPVVTQQEVQQFKRMKYLKWQQKLREDFILEKIGVKQQNKEDMELLEWCKNIDYFKYESEWKDFGTNVFGNLLQELRIDDSVGQFGKQSELDKQIKKRPGSGIVNEVEGVFEDGGFRVE